MRSRSCEAGYALAELLVALGLGSLLAVAALGWLAAEVRWANAVARRTAVADAFRLVQLLIPQELRFLLLEADLDAIGGDSAAFRVLRGTGVVCAVDIGSVRVRLRASRAPDATKDSLLWLDGAAEVPLALSSVASDPAGCAAGSGEAVFRMSTSGSPPPAAVVLLFERGVYYLQGSALRYRRGAGGRQPLTEALLDDAGSGFALDSADGAPAVVIRLRALAAPHAANARSWKGRASLLNGSAFDARR